MSLDTYDNLKLEIIDFSHRNDLDLKIDTFIDQLESDLFANQVSPLKTRSGETRSTAILSTASRFLELPPGFKEMRRLHILREGQSPLDIDYKTPKQLPISNADGRPQFYTITSQLEFDRLPSESETIEMQYYADFVPLSPLNQTNFILTDTPNIYLFGSLWGLFLFSDQFQESAEYYTLYITSLQGLNKKSKMGRYGPAPRMRILGSTP